MGRIVGLEVNKTPKQVEKPAEEVKKEDAIKKVVPAKKKEVQ